MVHRQPAKCRYDGHFKRSPALHALIPCCFSSYIIYQIDIFLDVFPRYTAIYANKFVYGAHYVSKNPKLTAVEQYISALSSHDMAVITDLYADDAVLEDPVGSDPLVGKAAIVRFYEVAFSSGISARLDGPVRLVANHAVFPFVVELNPGNGEMRIDVIDQFTFNDDNKIVAMKAFWGEANMTTA
ncbi:MAG: nuclear transport factor 2 family protein [Zhongshania sp.]|jgi:steroid delta-isomerase|nr:nuclear transport factor 2 family protein [Zhongshania sp.]